MLRVPPFTAALGAPIVAWPPYHLAIQQTLGVQITNNVVRQLSFNLGCAGHVTSSYLLVLFETRIAIMQHSL
jgi:hypothetical protein